MITKTVSLDIYAKLIGARLTVNFFLKFLIAVISLFFFPAITQATPILQLTDSKTEFPLGKYIHVLEDPEGLLSITDIVQQKYQAQYKTYTDDHPSLGYTRSAFWIKLQVQNQSSETKWIIDQAFANTHYLDLYIPSENNQSYKISKSGNLRPFVNRDTNHRRIIFKLTMDVGEMKTIYLRYQNQDSTNFAMTLIAEDAFVNADRIESFWMGIYYGLMSIILVLNIILYLSFKNSSYSYLILFVMSLSVSSLFYDGYGQTLLSSNSVAGSQHILLISLAIAMFSLLSFVKTILQLSPQNKLIHYSLIAAWSFLALLNPFIDYSVAIALNIPLLYISLIYMFTTCFFNFGKLKIAARIIAFGMIVSFFSYAIFSMLHFGIIDHSVFSELGTRAGIITILMLMSVSIIEHVQRLTLSGKKSTYALSKSQSKQKLSDEKFSTIFYDQPIAMQTIDLETAQRIDVNNYFCELFGYDREELLSKTAFEINLWHNPDEQKNAFKRLIKNKTAHNESLRMCTRSGKILNVLVSANALDFDNRKLAVISFIDVTQNQKIEDELRESNDKFFKIFQSSPSSIIMASLDTGEIIEVNQTFENTFGHSNSDLHGKTTFDINLWKNNEDRTRLFDLISTDNFGREEKLELLNSSGNTVLVDSHFFKISIAGKRYTISTLLDITEQNQTEQTMRDIAIGVSAEIGDDFYQKLVLQLSKVFKVDYVFIALINHENSNIVDTIAMSSHGKPIDNISYTLRGTPCAKVLNQELCVYPEAVQRLFPTDQLLIDMNIESYIGAPLLNSSGTPIGLISLMDSKPLQKTTQVTEILKIFAARATTEIERSQSHQELVHTQRSFALHVKQTPLAVIEWNTDFEVLAWNPAAQKIFGYTEDEAIGKTASELIIPEEFLSKANSIWHSLLSDKGGSTSHNVNLTKDGSIIICDWYNTPLVTENGEVIGVTSLAADVTKEEQTQLTLINKEKEQSEILNSTFDGIISINETGVILTYNKSAENLFGFSPDEIIGRNIRKLMPPQIASQHDGYLQRYVNSNVPRIIGTAVEVTAQRKDKSVFPMRLSVAELSPDHNGKKRFIGSCQDLTQIKQKEEQLRRSQKMDALGKLTGGIAHDFNNLLGVILGYSDLLEKTLDEQPKQSRYANQIKRAGERGAKLTKKLLAFSRKRSADFDVININNLVENQQHLLEKMLTARISLNLDLEEDIWLIEIDEGELEDSILNMSINAMHAIHKNGRLTLKTNNTVIDISEANILQLKAGNYVVFSVTDTGCGIDASTIDKIFDPFYSTKGEKGTGLGLSQVYGFMESCGGAIKVYSEKDKGTQFTLYFPQHKENGRSTSQVEHIQPKDLTGTEAILVLDDELSLRQLAQEILTQKGYQVLTAERPSEALSLLESNSIDLLLSDVIMPEMDGYQLASIVSEKYPTVKIQLASGFTDDRHENIKNDQLHKQLLKKPFTPQALLLRIRKLLDNGVFNNS